MAFILPRARRGKAGYLWCLTASSASFSEYLETFTPPFPCRTGRPRSLGPRHFGASGVTFRPAWASLGLRLPRYSQPPLPSPALCARSIIAAVFLRPVASDEGGKDSQSAVGEREIREEVEKEPDGI